MNKLLPLLASVVAVVCLFPVNPADAQPLGTFSWQLQPFCNRVVINVTQNGAVYTFDGWDDQCGGSNPRAPLVGTGTVNPDGTIGFGLAIVTAPGGAPLHVNATITLPSVNGTWRDSAGNSGAFILSAATGGPPRPAVASGDITAVNTPSGSGLTGGATSGSVTLSTDPAIVQSRITATCPAGQMMVSVNQNGTVNCSAPAVGGTITSVNTPAGSGLTGGATSGDVTLAVDPANVQTRIGSACPAGQLMVSVNQNGTVNCQTPAAVGGGTITAVNTPAGSGLAGGATTGSVTLAVDPTVIQSRISASCPAGQLMAGVNQNGTVNCQTPVGDGAGTITAVNTPAGSGLTGGATSGAVTLNVAFAGTGAAAAAARSDHTHAAGGDQNLGVGPSALAAVSPGSIGNLGIGHQALSSIIVAQANTAVGSAALKVATSNFNTAVGAGTLQSLTTGTRNTSVGSIATPNLVGGNDNTAVGYNTLFLTTTGSRNTAIGVNALTGTNASDNTAVGYNALALNAGFANVAVGVNALDANTTGSGNVAIGNDALTTNTAGGGNIAIGASALAASSTGGQNIAVGNFTLGKNTTGIWNVAVGDSALSNAETDANTAVGQSALTKTTGGSGNTAVGALTLDDNLTGTDNTGVGLEALPTLTSGSRNVGIGLNAGNLLTTGSDNLYLAAGAGGPSEATTTRIGSAQTRAFVAGIRGVNVAGGQTVMVDANGQLGITASSRSTKQDIADLDAAAGLKLQRLRPVQFRYQQSVPDGSKPLEYGLIAEEVEDVFRELVSYDAQGEPQTVRYHLLPSLLLAEVQRLEKERAEMKRAADAMARELADLRGLVETLRRER